jgi:hypothetical protein
MVNVRICRDPLGHTDSGDLSAPAHVTQAAYCSAMSIHTGVYLSLADGSKEFIDEAHVHGFREGDLLIASGPAEGGLDAEVIRRVAVTRLAFAETRNVVGSGEPDDGPSWTIAW